MKKIIFIICLSFISKAQSQNVAINTTGVAPADAAALDITSTDKGLLIPHVALTSVIVFAPLTGTPVDGLLVYNTSVLDGLDVGFYFWRTSDSRWVRLQTALSHNNLAGSGGRVFSGIVDLNYTTSSTVSATANSFNNTGFLGTNLTVTIPPYTTQKIVISYSIPARCTTASTSIDGRIGVDLYKNGVILLPGCRAQSIVSDLNSAQDVISGSYSEEITNSTGSTIIVNYNLRGTVRNQGAGTMTGVFNNTIGLLTGGSPTSEVGEGYFSLATYSINY